MPLTRIELRHVLEIGVKRKRNLGLNVSDLKHSHHEAQLFYRPGAACAAVADKPGGLVGPFWLEEVDGVLEGTRNAPVVFGSDEHESVEGVNLRRPRPSVLLRV